MIERKVKLKVWHEGYKKMFYGTEDDFTYTMRLDGTFLEDGGEHIEEAINIIPLQYIDIEDKNGKEICEGDIVKVGESNLIVSLEDGYFYPIVGF